MTAAAALTGNQIEPIYSPRIPLRNYQRVGLDRMRDRKAFALLMRMRTGKTAVALADWGSLEASGKSSDLLVVAPAGAYRTWVDECDKHLAPDLRLRRDLFIWESAKAKNAGAKARLNAFMRHDGPRILIVNAEALSIVSTGAREVCQRFLGRNRGGMLVVDESTVIKNINAKRTKYLIQKLRPMATYRRILTGQPTPKSPLDLYAQYQFLDPTILRQPSWVSFRNRYAIVKMENFPNSDWPVPVIQGYQRQDELKRLIDPHSYRVDFRPDIPSTFTRRDVSLTEEQQNLYQSIEDNATAQLSETAHITATIVIVQMLRLHQIVCGIATDEAGIAHPISERKTETLLELLEDYDGKAIIWCTYDMNVRRVSNALKREYGEGSVARFWGGNVNTREAEEHRFKTLPGCRWMIGTPAAGRFGRTWDMADFVIYYSSSYDLEHREQSEQRAQNVGKQRGVDYIDLLAPDTVEEKIVTALRDKLDLAQQITGDNWREWLINSQRKRTV